MAVAGLADPLGLVPSIPQHAPTLGPGLPPQKPDRPYTAQPAFENQPDFVGWAGNAPWDRPGNGYILLGGPLGPVRTHLNAPPAVGSKIPVPPPAVAPQAAPAPDPWLGFLGKYAPGTPGKGSVLPGRPAPAQPFLLLPLTPPRGQNCLLSR